MSLACEWTAKRARLWSGAVEAGSVRFRGATAGIPTAVLAGALGRF